MESSILLDPIQILYNSKENIQKDAVLIINKKIISFGDKARKEAKIKKVSSQNAEDFILAPCLIDPHSILEEPVNGKTENLSSLTKKAAISGYGQIAILPRSNFWRDDPEKIQSLFNNKSDVIIHALGGFSRKGNQLELSPHADLLNFGAIGLAEDDSMPDISILKKGLILGEIGLYPLLLAPRSKEIQANGIVRQSVETLRAGWHPDPIETESIPLSQILELHRQHPRCSIRLMNISTKAGVSMLKSSKSNLITSVCWWHLVADNSTILPTDLGWKVIPSIGSSKDRKALIKGLKEKVITAISVNSIPLNEEQTMQPEEVRPAGLTGYQLVLPALWQELIIKSGFSIEQLWDCISFGPSRMLNIPEESIEEGSRRWLIFDPKTTWINHKTLSIEDKVANEPWKGKKIIGKVIACGLIN